MLLTVVAPRIVKLSATRNVGAFIVKPSVVALTGAGYLAALYLLGLEEDDLSVWTQVRRTTARL